MSASSESMRREKAAMSLDSTRSRPLWAWICACLRSIRCWICDDEAPLEIIGDASHASRGNAASTGRSRSRGAMRPAILSDRPGGARPGRPGYGACNDSCTVQDFPGRPREGAYRR
jgi:hypothetical protein